MSDNAVPVNVQVDTIDAEVPVDIQNTGMINLGVEGTMLENDYNNLYNKPKINDVTLVGNKSFPDLHLNSITTLELLEILN